MTGITLGVTAFVVLFWVDAVSLKGMRLVKPALWLISGALFVVGCVLTLRQPPHFPVPGVLAVTGVVLASVSGLLLFYSLFIEIPFVSAYVQKGSPLRLVTRGTYALCRHPGVLWLAGLLAGTCLARGSVWMLAALPVWVGVDVLYVILQEKLFFVRMFGPEYREYQRSVPMLVPTSRSVRDCARTIFMRGERPRRHDGNAA
jgi:protein-S-isoprenylcysteine O-methyltransferase Ste14